MTKSLVMREGCGHINDVFEPIVIKHELLIPIGTRVQFTHLAAVVRWKPEYKSWKIIEPKQDWYPPMSEDVDDRDIFDTSDFWGTPVEGINKSVIVWKKAGESFLFGFVRRGIGESTKSHYTPSTYFGEAEFDQGYFDAKLGYVPLYALKSHLEGINYLLAPVQAVKITGAAPG